MLTQTEYAKHRGFKSRSTIARQIKKLGVPLHDGKIDPVEADAILDAAKDRSGRGNGKRTPGPKASNEPRAGSFGEAQAKREHWKAKLAELDYKRKAGEVHGVAACERSAFELGRKVRDAILNVPNRLSGVLAAESDAHKVHTLLLKELHQALGGLQ